MLTYSRRQLKCTSGQRPCLNCQLYNTQCISSDRGRRRSILNSSRHSEHGNEVAGSTIHVGGHETAYQHDDSSVCLSINPAAETSPTFESQAVMAPSWSHYAGLHGETVSQRARHDFRHSGDAVPPDLWDFDSKNSEEFFDINTDLLAPEVEAETDLRAQPPPNGELDNFPSISPGVSASKPSAQNLTRGKVSSIETLRGEGGYPNSQSHAVPPAVYIRQNETQGQHLSE